MNLYDLLTLIMRDKRVLVNISHLMSSAKSHQIVFLIFSETMKSNDKLHLSSLDIHQGKCADSGS